MAPRDGGSERHKPAPTDRAYYEAQGRRALEEGTSLDCSEPTVRDAVIAMARAWLDGVAVLDVGCGANLAYDRFLADMGMRPICADFSLSFLTLAPKDPRMPLLQADATALPFRDSSFDSVICSETIEHVPRDDQVIREIARVLRPRGILIVTVPNLWNASRLSQMVKQRDFAVHLAPGHLREYTPGHLRRLLRPYFEIVSWPPVTFGWTGRIGGSIDSLVRLGLFKRFSKSIAFVARRKASAIVPDSPLRPAGLA